MGDMAQQQCGTRSTFGPQPLSNRASSPMTKFGSGGRTTKTWDNSWESLLLGRVNFMTSCSNSLSLCRRMRSPTHTRVVSTTQAQACLHAAPLQLLFTETWSVLRCCCMFAADLSWCHNIGQVGHWLPSRQPLQVSASPQSEPNSTALRTPQHVICYVAVSSAALAAPAVHDVGQVCSTTIAYASKACSR
jgi:hypothetical protein